MLDAIHFKERAARARELAQSGDDFRLSRMLLELALDLDAEAAAIEAERGIERRESPRVRPPGVDDAILHHDETEPDGLPVQIINLSVGGAKIRVGYTQAPGNVVTLELPRHDLLLRGTVCRVRGTEVAMAFDANSTGFSALGILLGENVMEIAPA